MPRQLHKMPRPLGRGVGMNHSPIALVVFLKPNNVFKLFSLKLYKIRDWSLNFLVQNLELYTMTNRACVQMEARLMDSEYIILVALMDRLPAVL